MTVLERRIAAIVEARRGGIARRLAGMAGVTVRRTPQGLRVSGRRLLARRATDPRLAWWWEEAP